MKPFALRTFTVAIIASLVIAATSPAPAVAKSDAEAETALGLKAKEIFEKRIELGTDSATKSMRDLLRQNPDASYVRLMLASLLAEKPTTLKKLSEALALIDGQEKEERVTGLAAVSLALRMSIATRLLEQTTKDLQNLTQQQKTSTETPLYLETMKTQIKELDSSVQPLRKNMQATQKALAMSFTGNQIRDDLRQLSEQLRRRWAYTKEKEAQTGRTLDKWLEEALAKVKDNMSRAEVARLLETSVAALEDGHTVVEMKTNEPRSCLPFRAIDTPEGATVVESLTLKLKPGDRLLTVGGRDVEETIAENATRISVSNASARRANAIARLPIVASEADNSVVIRIERDGIEENVTCKTESPDSWAWSPQAIRQKWIRSRLFEPSVGYVRIAAWSPLTAHVGGNVTGTPLEAYAPYLKEIDAAMAPLKKCKDIIVDVRGNTGSQGCNMEVCGYLASYFTEKRPLPLYVLRHLALPARDGGKAPGAGDDGYYNPDRNPDIVESVAKESLKARIWILVDECSFSETHAFIQLMVSSNPAGQVRLVGRPCNAGISVPLRITALRNSGAEILASTCQAFSLKGDLLEGKPTPIDLPVTWTRTDILAGGDPDLNAALAAIRKPAEERKKEEK